MASALARNRTKAGVWARLRIKLAFAAGALALALVGLAFADEAHTRGGTAAAMSGGGPLLWGLLSLGGVLVGLVATRALLVRGVAPVAGAATGAPKESYLDAVRQFSRNAKLFLTYSILAELGSGIWSVMFNLYLLRAGFEITFIGTFWLVNMLCHGLAALPAGILADRFGRRRSFFIATSLSVVAQGSLLFTQSPAAILVLAGIAGFGDAFHGVTGAPFMMENSEPKERPHLFSLNAAFLQVSRFAGSLTGGFMPLLWAGVIGVPDVDPQAARWALVTGLPLTLIALLPLAFMREKPVELAHSFKELLDFPRMPSFKAVMQLTLLSVMVGTAFGLTIRFFNVFFQEAHGASDGQIGTTLALGSIAGAGAILISPLLAQRWGKVKSILFTQAASVPLLMVMALVPSFSVVTALFLFRGAMYSISQPLRNQLSMELVTSKERGTTAGFSHAAFDLGGSVGAGAAGILIAGGGFATAFTAAAILILVPAALYFTFFEKRESQSRQAAPAPGAVAAAR
ncbi:MAG: MFS transporter [Chloroflexi bacterium]|nr:MFS transporter [Chloroflexota bacterium]